MVTIGNNSGEVRAREHLPGSEGGFSFSEGFLETICCLHCECFQVNGLEKERRVNREDRRLCRGYDVCLSYL